MPYHCAIARVPHPWIVIHCTTLNLCIFLFKNNTSFFQTHICSAAELLQSTALRSLSYQFIDSSLKKNKQGYIFINKNPRFPFSIWETDVFTGSCCFLSSFYPVSNQKSLYIFNQWSSSSPGIDTESVLFSSSWPCGLLFLGWWSWTVWLRSQEVGFS